MTFRHGNTGKEITALGEFAKIAKKTYQHIDGAVIAYDCNAWGWRINAGKEVYSALHGAVSAVRREANAA